MNTNTICYKLHFIQLVTKYKNNTIVLFDTMYSDTNCIRNIFDTIDLYQRTEYNKF